MQELKKHLPENFTGDFLLKRALTHRSYFNENKDAVEDNERLEFLGDSILNFVVAEWLYNRFPEKQEGFLTKIRSALVHTKQLATFAREIELGDALLLGKGEDQAGGRDRDAILCDAFEALVAAIYLGTDMDTVKAFVFPFVEAQAGVIVKNHSEIDVKSRLQEWAQSQGFPSPIYQLISAQGPDHSKTFEVGVWINNQHMASGKGPNKQAAEKAAADHCIQMLGIRE